MGSTSSTVDPGSVPQLDTVLVGAVRRPHGLAGEVVVEVLSDIPERFEGGRELLVRSPGGGLDRRVVVAARRHRGALLLRLAGCDDRSAAESLRGASLEVPRSEVPPAPRGTYYYFQLLGCRCRDRRAGELGTVEDLVEDGGGLLLVVRGGGREVPVPFVGSFLARVDLEAKVIDLDLPEGLVEACGFES